MEEKRPSLKFPSGEEVRSLEEFAKLATAKRKEAEEVLYSGALEKWLEEMGEVELALLARGMREGEPNRAKGLSSFLEGAGIATRPRLFVRPTSLEFGPIPERGSRTLTLQILNLGSGLLMGEIESSHPQIVSVEPSRFEGNKITVKVTASSVGLPLEKRVEGRLSIRSNGGNAEVPFWLEVVRASLDFEDGERVFTVEEFKRKVYKKWPEVVRMLSDGRLEGWLRALGHEGLARAASEAKKKHIDPEVALQTFLEQTKLGRPPTPTVGRIGPDGSPEFVPLETISYMGKSVHYHSGIDLGSLLEGEVAEEKLVVANASEEGFLYGKVKSDSNWLIPEPKEIKGNRQELTVRIRTDLLPSRREHKATLTLETNAGPVYVPFTLRLIPKWVPVLIRAGKYALVAAVAVLLALAGMKGIERALGGTLSVLSSPPHARVYIDGKFVGRTGRLYRLSLGDHEVRLAKGGHEDRTFFVKAKPRQMVKVKAKLSPIRKALHYFRKAQKLAKRKNWERVVRECKAALKADPDYEEALHLLGVAYLNLKKFDEAIKAFEKALKVAPDRSSTRVLLASAYMKVRRYDKAVAQYKEAVKRRARDPRLHAQLAEAHLKRGEFKSALKELCKAKELAPKDPDIRAKLASLYVRLGKLDDAKREFRVALRYNPKHVEAQCGLAEVMLRQGRPKEALSLLREVTKEHPHLARAHFLIAQAHDKLGRTDEAIEAYKRTVGLEPKNVEARMALARALSRRGKHEEAAKQLRQLLKVLPNHVQAQRELALEEARAGNIEVALKMARRALSKSPSAGWERTLGLIHWLDKKPKLAKLHLERALRMGPAPWEWRAELAAVRLELGEVDKALSLLKKATTKAPSSPLVHRYYAQALWRKGLRREALVSWERALHLRPDLWEVRSELADAYLQARRPKKALKVVRQQLHLVPKDERAHLKLAQLLWKMGRRKEAIRTLERATKSVPEPQIFLQLSLYLSQTKQAQKALAVLQRGVEALPKSAELRIALAKALSKHDHHEEAIEHLMEAVKLRPDDFSLKLLLAKEQLKAKRREEARKVLEQILAKAPEKSRWAKEAKSILEKLAAPARG